jgi:hypothetical protein
LAPKAILDTTDKLSILYFLGYLVGVILFIKIGLKNNEIKKYDNFDKNIFNLITEEYEKNNILYIIMTVKENDMQIEFGHNCFFVSMTNEEKAEIYNFINDKEQSNEFIDLFINCYPKNMLFNNIIDLMEIIQTFFENGEPNLKYKLEIIPM